MNLVNLTPHAITLLEAGCDYRVLAPSGQVARCSTSSVQVGVFDDVPLFRTVGGAVTGLPDPQSDTMYIVSALVRLAVPDRTDVASPGELVRNADGQPIGCHGLVVN